MDQVKQPLWRHPGFLLLYSIGATMLAIALSSGLAHIAPSHQAGWGAVVFACGVAAIFVAVYVAFSRFLEGRPASEFLLAPAGIELPAGIVTGVVIFSLIVGVIAAFGGYRVIGYRDAGVLVPALAVAILSGFTEEIFFRGFFFRLTEKWLGTWAALGLSAALFGALHLGNPNATLLAAVAIMLEAGIMLAAIYMITRRLWAAIGVHAAWNFTQGGIYGIPVSGGEMDGVLRPDIRGSDLLTGGAFGAEASLPAIVVATAFGLLLLYVAWRRGQFMSPFWKRTPPPSNVGDTFD
jgi:membrane protease YdiL (CAAX protease family)